MQRHSLYILVLCLFAATGLGWFLQQTPATTLPDELPLGQLQRTDIKTISVADARGPIANLELEGEQWWETISGYRADEQRIDNLLHRLFKARILETKTRRADLYNRLGVEPVSAPGARGVELSLGSDSAIPYVMTFGDNTGNGQYMRPDTEPVTLLISPAVELPVDRINWLDRELLNIPAAELTRITLQHADGGRVELVKTEPGQQRFTLLNVPQDRQLATPDAANRIAGILSELRMESARRIEQLAQSNADVTGEFETRNGDIIHSQAFITADGVYFTFASMNKSAPDDAQLAWRLQGWAYALPGFKQKQFLTRIDELLQ